VDNSVECLRETPHNMCRHPVENCGNVVNDRT
jgi:hypothetical protein